jgi:AbrB family looped-hinge helix DNA binding protein
MRTTIDRAGRIVVPKALRQAIGLEPGAEIEMQASDGRIELGPAPLEVRLERRGRLLVAVPTGPTPTLSASTVEKAVSVLRGERKRRRR